MRKARRHREELGEVIEVFGDRPGPKTVMGFVLGWLIFTGLTLINPGETPLLAAAPGIRPYAIPYQQITPGSIAGVTAANRYLKEVGLQRKISQSTLRAS